MRRLNAATIAVVLAAAALAGLFASGIVSVQITVNVPAPGPAGAATTFWHEKAGGQLPAGTTLWVDLARTTKPAVVNVSTTQRGATGPLADEFFRRFFDRERPFRERRSLGSGFVASPDGYVVTNFHVVRDASEVVVRLVDQREFKARVVGTDPKTDLSLLKIDAKNLTVIPFGDSDKLEVGEPVMTIGNPFGLDQTVTTGIVSAKERFIGSGPYDDFIQTDAAVNPGNSGGPLIDARGAVIGINTAIFSQSGGWAGIGFATPVNLAKEILPQLREHGRVTRGFLGIATTSVSSENEKEAKVGARDGAVVAEVRPGSPAAQAGLKVGDVIVHYQGHEIHQPQDLSRRVAATPPGTKAKLDVVNAGARRTVEVTVGELKDERPTAPSAPKGR
jgi:serine protease Do